MKIKPKKTNITKMCVHPERTDETLMEERLRGKLIRNKRIGLEKPHKKKLMPRLMKMKL